MAVAPEMDDDGNLMRVFGVIVDISDRKRAESEQRKRLDEAVELKRHQENFIDMVSHEVFSSKFFLTIDAKSPVRYPSIFRHRPAMSNTSQECPLPRDPSS